MSQTDDTDFTPYEGPAGGWGSLKSVTNILVEEGDIARAGAALLKQNKPDGYACVSCAWAKPADPLPAEFCENGAKATAWELTTRTVTPAFFKKHTVSELRTWADHDLEDAGRLTEPMRYDRASDRYVPVSWDDAFADIGRTLATIDPKAAVFYVSGRASLETSYMWSLFARAFGSNNLPDSSNMCHESTSVALPQTIGIPVGTVTLDDFGKTDCILFFGQNVGVNSPRMLHQLQEAARRKVPIITFNPLKERGLERFTNPQSPAEMVTGHDTRISSQYHQLKAGGDIAAILGMIKALLAADEAAKADKLMPVLDHAFMAEHTVGFDDLAAKARSVSWERIEAVSGLSRSAIEQAAAVYGRSRATILVYGMGLTQHRTGVENVQMACNLLLLKGNIGRPGAGICPVRGHSNVQGQRTVGVSEKPDLVPLDRIAEQHGFEPPREKGLNTVEACEGIIDGSVKAFLGLGGNFLRAVPETGLMESAWERMELTVQVATKLNRNHLFNGRVAYLLPCRGRIEVDMQRTGRQWVSVESSTAHIHASHGLAEPIADTLRSEPAIVAGLAKATVGGRTTIPWDEWVADYSKIRDAIEATYPDIFRDFNTRAPQPGGFHRPLAARDRVWKTETGKATFITPKSLDENPDAPADAPDVIQLITVRSNDQFNTTIYGYHDRFRGISGTRMVILIGGFEMARLGLADGDIVTLATAVDDGVERSVSGFRVVRYDVPMGCAAAYYPECNPLIPLWHHAEESKVPAAKSVPVRITRMEAEKAA